MNTQNKQTTSLVFSFRNEEDVLQELINRVVKSLGKVNYEYELIFVNDASTDKSLEILEENRKRNQRIKIINMSRKFGVSPCVMAGLRYASGNCVTFMDSDLQDPPEILPDLIRKWEDGNDVVHTVRTKRKGENFIRMILVKIAYKVIDAVSDIKIIHNSGNFKLISRRALDSVLKLNEYDPFFRGLPAWVGYRQAKVNYIREPRIGGKSKFSMLGTRGIYEDFIRGITSFSSLPLYISLLMGFFVGLGAFIFLIIIIVQYFLFGIDNSGWPTLMVTLLFLGGTILFAIGILGIYIGKIHNALKNRPQYIIESEKGFVKTNN